MDHALAPCPSCTRHVRTHEARCPFCDASFEAPSQRVHFAAVTVMAAAFLVPAEGFPKELPTERMRTSAPVAAYGGPSELGFPEPAPSPPVGPEAVAITGVQVDGAHDDAVVRVVARILRRGLPARVARCYRSASNSGDPRAPSLRLQAEVATHGHPRSVTVTSAARGDSFERCVITSTRMLVFPRRSEAITVSFVLQVAARR